MVQLACDKYGRRILLQILAPGVPRYFPEDDLQMLQPIFIPTSAIEKHKASVKAEQEELEERKQLDDLLKQKKQMELAMESGHEYLKELEQDNDMENKNDEDEDEDENVDERESNSGNEDEDEDEDEDENEDEDAVTHEFKELEEKQNSSDKDSLVPTSKKDDKLRQEKSNFSPFLNSTFHLYIYNSCNTSQINSLKERKQTLMIFFFLFLFICFQPTDKANC